MADVYEGSADGVTWYGKPHPAIYDHALRLAGDPPTDEVLAVGDGLQTDVLGAARMGFDTVFVTGGIHAGEPFPDDFGAAKRPRRAGTGGGRRLARLDSRHAIARTRRSGSTSPSSSSPARA